MIIEPLGTTRLSAWAALFETCNCPCYCRYWHFSGDKNAWLERCATAKELNFAEHEARVQANQDDARGLLALEDDRAIGWMKLTPRATVPKLRKLPVYRSTDLGPDEGVYSVGCFLVHPAHRGRGVARALLAAADAQVIAWGGRAIEAYPRRTPDPMHPEEAWLGPLSIFQALGYREIASPSLTSQYPVFRKSLE